MRNKEETLFEKWKEMVHSQSDAIFVTDGIVDQQAWKSAPTRVLYLLKEVNGGDRDWDERDYLARYNEDSDYLSTHSPTIDILTKWQYGITKGKNYKKWEAVEQEACQMNQQATLLRQIALVNLKKTAGGGVVDWNKFDAYFAQKHNREFLKEQLSFYDSDVVVCGGTAWHLCQIMGWNLDAWNKTSRGVRYCKVGTTVYVDFWHPNNRGPKNLLYFGLIDALAEIGNTSL